MAPQPILEQFANTDPTGNGRWLWRWQVAPKFPLEHFPNSDSTRDGKWLWSRLVAPQLVLEHPLDSDSIGNSSGGGKKIHSRFWSTFLIQIQYDMALEVATCSPATSGALSQYRFKRG